jgi:hypothetical protein
MPLTSTVLFGLPQQEIASLVMDRIANSSMTSIISGFLTPGGLAAIAAPIKTRPLCLKTLVVGAATYPGFEALDELIAAGVPANRLHVHLGHSAETGGRKILSHDTIQCCTARSTTWSFATGKRQRSSAPTI